MPLLSTSCQLTGGAIITWFGHVTQLCCQVPRPRLPGLLKCLRMDRKPLMEERNPWIWKGGDLAEGQPWPRGLPDPWSP